MNSGNAKPSRYTLPPLDLLLGFESAARLLSFTKAAQELNLTQSAISRQIKSLEDHLGVALFERHNRALTLTGEGRLLLDTTVSCLDQLRAVTARLNPQIADEQIVVTTTPGMAALWLIPRLARFTTPHPHADVRISATLELVDVERVDFAIRYTRLAAGRGTLLFGERNFPVCSPQVKADAAGNLERPGDLAAHTILAMSGGPATLISEDWDLWLRSVGLATLQPARIIWFDQYHEVIAAALAGHGIAMGRMPLVSDALDEGRLVAAFSRDGGGERGYYLIESRRAASRALAAAFRDWLIEEARISDPTIAAVMRQGPIEVSARTKQETRNA